MKNVVFAWWFQPPPSPFSGPINKKKNIFCGRSVEEERSADIEDNSDISEEKDLSKDISMEVQDETSQDFRHEDLEDGNKPETGEYNYEDDDFEDYDDDFEADEDNAEEMSEDDTEEDRGVEKKLDSGNYELESGRRRRELRELAEMQQVKEAIRRENSSKVKGKLHLLSPQYFS